ncbi:MAG: DUF523 domain-containing protein [Sphingobacteriales bacterium]|nr:MAG: DUF523 domain-containing protein [Sphingobacteriales bacterium]
MKNNLPDTAYLQALPQPSAERPLPILFSSCIAGKLCGWDGSSYGEFPLALQIYRHKLVKPVLFCPEDFVFGTPRALCNIHGGDGFDVLDGKAKVLTESGEDWTEGMLHSAQRMLQIAKDREADLALLMDISAACGSQVIYNGKRTTEAPVYQAGPGVCAALLIRNGFRVVSQRDFRTLGLIMKWLDPAFEGEKDAKDHHEHPWYKEYFNT